MPPADIHDQLNTIDEKQDKILLILQGNGHPRDGLVTKHELLAASVVACQKRHVSGKKDLRWWATLSVAVAAILVAYFK